MRIGMISRLGGLAAVVFSLLASSALANDLTVYTALEADLLPIYKKSFEDRYPGVNIRWVRDSTGIITAKLLAEKDNPQADAVLGTAATSLQLLDNEGMLEHYAPKGLDKIDPRFVSRDTPPTWVGANAWAAALCVNTVEMKKRNLAIPQTWADLARPEYKGLIVMPNPASSGTGFLDVSSWLQMMGDEKGWAYMEALHQNIATYTHSGSKPCTLAASGEYPIGISFEFRAARVMSQGAPVVVVVPSEGVGWDVEASAIVKGTPNEDDARKLIDWAVSDDAMKIYAKYYAILGNAAFEEPIPNLPTDIKAKLSKNDFEWAAAHRADILDAWQKRFGAKSEAKN
ncbi:iron(III) transport system substrate-binding protein [Roseiarcus fermentans]|uniref:Iron(III) transport system substrate-binding protein n=1 Tax=Roseiarcus fermentans TaxID=1473586 RepID=A0A366FUB7_9HYPH|nr:putative 2-aminoethylphosphonate ABC transporter substrate-binding protein [Roseiarcus fermentans]RBP17650.1 iron(III) transport system substrate-binding protein [Roseiarcus fermentans]